MADEDVAVEVDEGTHVPDPAAIVGTFDTTGLNAGAHEQLHLTTHSLWTREGIVSTSTIPTVAPDFEDTESESAPKPKAKAKAKTDTTEGTE